MGKKKRKAGSSISLLSSGSCNLSQWYFAGCPYAAFLGGGRNAVDGDKNGERGREIGRYGKRAGGCF